MSCNSQSPLVEKPGKVQKKEARNGSPWVGVEQAGGTDQTSTVEDDRGGKEEESLVT